MRQSGTLCFVQIWGVVFDVQIAWIRVVLLAMTCSLCACSAYDAKLISVSKKRPGVAGSEGASGEGGAGAAGDDGMGGESGTVCVGADCEMDASAQLPCLMLADCDDHLACTRDALAESDSGCATACERPLSITEPMNGDTCCPPGATAASDADCEPACGNDVVDPGEDCDGGPGCVDCKLNSAQNDCVDRLSMPGTESEECRRCACTNCTTETLACLDDADTDRKAKCDTLVACALAKDCAAMGCYCGDTPDPSCFFPMGDCIPEVESAANTDRRDVILLRLNDTNFALGRAVALTTCARTACPSHCPQ